MLSNFFYLHPLYNQINQTLYLKQKFSNNPKTSGLYLSGGGKTYLVINQIRGIKLCQIYHQHL